MDNRPELEKQTDQSRSLCWGTITRLAPDPLPCLSRLTFHSSAEHCHGLFLPVSSSPTRRTSSAWSASCSAAMSGMLSLRDDQRLMLSATGAGGCPASFPNQLHKEEYLRTLELTLSGLAPTRTTSLGQLQWLRLLTRLPPAPGTLVVPLPQPWTNLRRSQAASPQALTWDLVKNHQIQDNLNDVFWTV